MIIYDTEMVSFEVLPTMMLIPIMPSSWLDGELFKVLTIGSFETVGEPDGGMVVMDTLNEATTHWVSTTLSPMPHFKFVSI